MDESTPDPVYDYYRLNCEACSRKEYVDLVDDTAPSSSCALCGIFDACVRESRAAGRAAGIREDEND